MQEKKLIRQTDKDESVRVSYKNRSKSSPLRDMQSHIEGQQGQKKKHTEDGSTDGLLERNR